MLLGLSAKKLPKGGVRILKKEAPLTELDSWVAGLGPIFWG